jgi:hypothetical protein
MLLVVSGCVNDERPPLLINNVVIGSNGSGYTSSPDFIHHYDDCGGVVCGILHHYDT